MTNTLPPRDVLASLDADTLTAAVETSRSWRQVLVKIGLTPNRHARRLRGLSDEWGISYAHFRYHVFSDEHLRDVLSTATSWSEVISRLGYAEDSGSARGTIRKHARRLGLDLGRLTARTRPAAASLPLQPNLLHLRQAGSYLVAGAFTLAGYRVCWPLEPAVYDLVVATDERMLRVQVKTTSQRACGAWSCSITRSEYAAVAGGKRKVRYVPDEVDAFAIVDGAGDVYVIPIEDVAGLTNLSMRRYEAYRVPRLGVGLTETGPE